MSKYTIVLERHIHDALIQEMKRRTQQATTTILHKHNNNHILVFLIDEHNNKTKYYIYDRLAGITTEKGVLNDMDIPASVKHFEGMGYAL